MKNKNKHKKLKITLITILILFICLIGAGLGYFYYSTSKMTKTPISKNNSDLGISKETEKKLDNYDNITNIAFFGLDTRVKDENSNSDCIMIITLDEQHKKIKISSIMRDTYVNIDGHGMNKINAAYSYGGPQLAIKTLNQNFGLNIKDFVKVDFFSLEKIVDNLGGIEVNVAQNEVNLINIGVDETARLEGESAKHISKSGLQILNGQQIVAYCRIRHTTGDDFKRTERQRDVLVQIINKIKSKGVSGITSTVNTLLPYVETSMSNTQVLGFCTSMITSGAYNTLDQERFPVDGYCWAGTPNGMDCIEIDTKTTSSQIQNYIFKDIKPVPKTPLVY